MYSFSGSWNIKSLFMGKYKAPQWVKSPAFWVLSVGPTWWKKHTCKFTSDLPVHAVHMHTSAYAHISTCTHRHMHTSAYAQVKFKNATDNFKSILNANFQFKNNYFTVSLWLAFTQRQTEYSKHHPTCPLIKRSLLNIPAENYKSHQFCNIPSKSKSIFLSILIKL